MHTPLPHDCVSNFIDVLRQHGGDPRETAPGTWKARCPAHEDSNPSLSITRGDDGRVLVKCFAGCDSAEVVKALGLSQKDLFQRPSHQPKADRVKNKEKTVYSSPEAAIERQVRERGEPTACYVYESREGEEELRVFRFDYTDAGKRSKDFRPVHRIDTGWVLGKPPGQLPLYRLPEVIKAERVCVCEGEKAADRIRKLGLVATTSAFGSHSPGKTDWAPLSGKEVILMPDNDESGENYIQKVQQLLTQRRPHPTIKILRVSEQWHGEGSAPKGADAVEFLNEGMPTDWNDSDRLVFLESLVDELVPLRTEQREMPRPYGGNDEDDEEEIDQADDERSALQARCRHGQKKSPVELVLHHASAAQLFQTQDGKFYATVKAKGRTEHHRIGSKAFEHWLTREFYLEHERPPSKEALQSAISP